MERESESLPQYKRLYELLRQNIENGLYKEGTLLPSENELCRRITSYNVCYTKLLRTRWLR